MKKVMSANHKYWLISLFLVLLFALGLAFAGQISGADDSIDTQAPSSPSNLAYSFIATTSVGLIWEPSTDNVCVTGYEVYNGQNTPETVTGTSVTVTSLQPDTSYSFTVRAKDAAGNLSEASNELTVTTENEKDTEPPTVPQGLTASEITDTGMVLTWEVSSDNVNVDGYEVYRNNELLGTVENSTFIDSGLQPNTDYSYSVKAFDGNNNKSETSTEYKTATYLTIHTDTTWHSQESILIRKCLVINTGAELTLEAGTAVKLRAGADVRVDGRISALSDEEHSVFFTCERDPDFGGDGVRNSDDYWGAVTVSPNAEFDCEDINFFYSENALNIQGSFYSSIGCNIVHNSSTAVLIDQNAQFDGSISVLDSHTGIKNKGTLYSYMYIESCAETGIETEVNSILSGSAEINDCRNGMIVDGQADLYDPFISDCTETGILVGVDGYIGSYEGSIQNCQKGMDIKGSSHISYMELRDCDYGLYLDSDQTQTFRNLSFLGSSTYGAFNNKSSVNAVDLTKCYWDSVYGPTVYDKEKETWIGEGAKVSEGIACRSWLGQEYQKEAHNSQNQGTYAPTGNYSRSDTDLIVPSDFGDIVFSRSYNSSDSHWGIFGRGWSSSYEGRIEIEYPSGGSGPLLLRTSSGAASSGTNFSLSSSSNEASKILVAYLPGGSSISYSINEDGTYTAMDSRNRLVRLEDGSYKLTAKNQSKLIFDENGILSAMVDRYGNRTQIVLDEYGAIIKIIDPALREFIFAYNERGLVQSITDIAGGRIIQYSYTPDLYSESKLSQVTDPLLNTLYYGYDENELLNSVKDHQQNVVESIEYFEDPEDDYSLKVHRITNRLGNTFLYDYDDTNGKTTIMDSNGRQTVQWYDRTFNITETIDSENRTQTTEYYVERNGLNKYWESKTVTDRYGNKTEYIRDLGNGNVTGIINPDLSKRHYSYDDKNNIIMERDETGRPVYYIYDGDGVCLLKTARPFDGEMEYASGSDDEDFAIDRYTYFSGEEAQSLGYKYKGLLKSHTDPMGNNTSYTYDPNGYLCTITDSAGNVTKKTNNSYGLVTKLVSPAGHSTNYTYDKKGNLEKRVEDNGATTRITYDFRGNKTKEVSPNLYSPALDNIANHSYSGNHGFRYTYYNNGLLHAATDAENNVTTYTYDLYGNIESEQMPNGAVYSYEYDVMNRPMKVLFSDGVGAPAPLREYEYLALENGNTETIETKYFNSADTATTTYLFDYAGRLIRQINPDETVIVTEYYPNGLVRSVTDPQNNTVLYEYDGLKRLIEEKTPFERIEDTLYYSLTKKQYDKNGNMTLYGVTSNKPGEEECYSYTGYEYDTRDLLVKVTNFDGETPESYTQYYYDADGNKVRMYTGLSQPLVLNGPDNITAQGDSDFSVTKYEYDYAGRLIRMIDPMNQAIVYGYDLNGNNTQTDDRNGNVTVMTYNKMDRMLSKMVTCSDGSKNVSTSYVYDSLGNVLTTSSGGILLTNTYDKMGRLTSERESAGILKEYALDLLGNRTAFILTKDNTTITELGYTYDNMGRLYQVINNGIAEATYQYDSNGNRETLTYGNGNSTLYVYSLNNKLQMLANYQGDSTISQYSYSYYLNGNQATKTELSGASTSYVYDGLGRLASETTTSGTSISYTFDDSGNRATMSVSGITMPYSVSYQYDANNRLVAEHRFENGINTITAYSYDNNGNQTGKGGISYGYDGLDRLISVVESGQNIAYTYNPNNLRRSKTVDGVTTLHVWDGTDIIAEYDGSGPVAKRYIRGINLIFADNGSSTDKLYFLYNAHGDVIQLTNATGSVIKNYDYDAFGNEKNLDNTDTNAFRYCGEYFDKETGTYYLRARYYDPAIGRFVTEDSYLGKDKDPLSLNLYTYCHNDPIQYYDPSGHIIDTVADIGFIIWDVGDLIADPGNGWNWASLGADVGCTFIPFATGGGRAVKIAVKAAEGTKKLTNAEKAMVAISKGEKLSSKMKDALRAEARTIIKNNSTDFMQAINKGQKLDVHHLIPLEYAQLFGKNFDPNNLFNLYGVDQGTHKLLNKAWNDFKLSFKELGVEPTKQDVIDFAAKTLKEFKDKLVQ
jgi:RHS repeat-associated protein